MVTKRRKGTAITALCVNVETEEFKRVPIFIRGNVKSTRKIEKIARATAETEGLNFIKADVEYVTLVYTMEDEDFYNYATEEVE